MAKIQSAREKKLQKKLIPVNIIVCIIALTAALTLFLTPIFKVDVGGILHSESVMELVEEKIEGEVDKGLDGTEQQDINYKPVVSMIIKNVLGKAEGGVTISALNSFRVLTGSGEASEMVMDELLLGDGALATKLIDSVVDAVADVFTTDEGKNLLEEAVVTIMTKKIVNEAGDEDVSKKLNDALTNENVKSLVGILRELETVEDGNVDPVANKFIDKVNEILGEGSGIAEEDRQSLVDEINTIYNDTDAELGEGESISMEAIICVTLSKNVDISDIKIENIINTIKDIGGGNKEGSVHIKAADDEIGSGVVEDEPNDKEPDENGGEQGGTTEGEEPSESGNTIVTSYDEFLLEIGYDEDKKAEIKDDLRVTLKDALTGLIQNNGIDDYMGYYRFIFLGMLAFIVPWLILFLFSFIRIFTKNKRFTMWYVKLICWIPAIIWLALTLVPVVVPKFIPDLFEGSTGTLIKSVLASVSTFTWISGLCYVLLWLISICWAFPIKHKIRKERKNPDVEDAIGD